MLCFSCLGTKYQSNLKTSSIAEKSPQNGIFSNFHTGPLFFKVSLFKEKFQSQTSKSSKQMYSLLPKFTSEITSSSFRHAINIKKIIIIIIIRRRKIFYSICKATSNNYHILMIDIIISFHSNIVFSCHHWYPLSRSSYFKL